MDNNTGSSGYLNGKRIFWALFGLCAASFFPFLGLRALWDPGESRYAEIAREMVESGDWLVPRLNYVRYFEKPPLGYWLDAASMKIFGINEFAVRFPTALAGFLAVLATCWFSFRLYGRRAAALSAAILFTCIGFFAYSQIPELDMVLTFFISLGLILFYSGFELGVKPAVSLYAAYAAFGLGCLVKGPVAFVLPFLIITAYVILTRQFGRWRELRLFGGVALATAVTAPWFIAICNKEPEFFDFFIVREHLQRYTSTMHSRKGAFWYFIPVLIAGLYPWIIVLPQALMRAAKKIKGGIPQSKELIFLALWIAIIFLFFSASGSKRPPYILLIFPPLALMLAGWWDEKWEEPWPLLKIITVPLIIFNAVLAAGLFIAPRHIQYLGPDARAALIPAAVVLAAGAAAVAYFSRKGKRVAFYVIFAASFVFNIVSYLPLSDYDTLLSRKAVAEKILGEWKDGEKIISYHADYERNLQSLNFYAGKRVYVLGDPGELEFGSGLEPRKLEYFLDDAAFLALLKAGRVYIVAKKTAAAELARKAGVRLYGPGILPGRLILLSNKPWSGGPYDN